jgi:hypothetical protein
MPTRYGSPDAPIRTLPHRQPPVNRSMLRLLQIKRSEWIQRYCPGHDTSEEAEMHPAYAPPYRTGAALDPLRRARAQPMSGRTIPASVTEIAAELVGLFHRERTRTGRRLDSPPPRRLSERRRDAPPTRLRGRRRQRPAVTCARSGSSSMPGWRPTRRCGCSCTSSRMRSVSAVAGSVASVRRSLSTRSFSARVKGDRLNRRARAWVARVTHA